MTKSRICPGLTVDLLHGPRHLNSNSRGNLLVDLLGINDMDRSSKDELVTHKFLRLTSPDMLLVWLGRAHRSVLVCSAQRAGRAAARENLGIFPLPIYACEDPATAGAVAPGGALNESDRSPAVRQAQCSGPGPVT